MNRKINGYVNFLLDNSPSPFCEYIIDKELLQSDEQTVCGSYEWAKMFKLYTELSDEQLPDGSWGGFEDSITADCKGKHFKTTARAMHRMLDLSLDKGDPMVGKALNICKRYLSGEAAHPNKWGKDNTFKPVSVNRSVARWVSYFEPENVFVSEVRYSYAERLKAACSQGYFNIEKWSGFDFIPKFAHFSYDINYMLSYGKCISEDIQRIWLTHEWNSQLWYNGNLPSDIKSPDDPLFIFWLVRLENLKDFSLFSEFMAEKTAPYLNGLCERLCDKNDDMYIKTNNYFYHQGQYTEPPWNKQQKKNDLLLRIIRLLNKCF